MNVMNQLYMCTFQVGGVLNYYFATLVATIMVTLSVPSASAQPTVTLEAQPQDNYHSVLFTFTQNDLPAMEGCHYNLFAANKRSKLSSVPGQGRSIATFYKPLSTIQIIAKPLPHLIRESNLRNHKILRRAKVYFRTLLSCPSATNGMGALVSITMKTFPRGKLLNVNQLIYSMKYDMQYYSGGT